MRARAARDDNVYAISALTGEGIAALLDAITETLQGKKRAAKVHLSFADGKKRAWLYAQELVDSEEQTEDGIILSVRWTVDQEAQFERL